MLHEGFEDIYHLETWEDVKNWIEEGLDEKALIDLRGIKGFDRILGTGQEGRAYKIKGKDLVLKLTTDKKEIGYGNKLEGRTDLKAFLKIFKCINVKGRSRSGELIPAQIRIQELCYDIDWSGLVSIGQYELLGWVQQYIDQIYEGYVEETGKTEIDYDFLEYFFDVLKQDPDFTESDFSDQEKEILLKTLQFGHDLLVDVKNLFGFSNLHKIDIHDDNVMQDKQGNFKLIDF